MIKVKIKYFGKWSIRFSGIIILLMQTLDAWKKKLRNERRDLSLSLSHSPTHTHTQNDVLNRTTDVVCQSCPCELYWYIRNKKYVYLVNSTYLSVFWPIIKKKGKRHDGTVKFSWFSCAWGMHHNMRRFWQCITLLPGNPFSFILLLFLLLLHKETEYYRKKLCHTHSA